MSLQASAALPGNRFLQCGGVGESSTGPTIVEAGKHTDGTSRLISVSYSDLAQMFTPEEGWVTIAPMKKGRHLCDVMSVPGGALVLGGQHILGGALTLGGAWPSDTERMKECISYTTGTELYDMCSDSWFQLPLRETHAERA